MAFTCRPSWRQRLDASVGVAALTTVGLANLLGTYIAGQSGRFIEKRRGLKPQLFRALLCILGLLFLPITPFTIIAMSAVLGLLWLSTVRSHSSLVATFFGTRWMSMLFGVVFLRTRWAPSRAVAGRDLYISQSYDI